MADTSSRNPRGRSAAALALAASGIFAAASMFVLADMSAAPAATLARPLAEASSLRLAGSAARRVIAAFVGQAPVPAAASTGGSARPFVLPAGIDRDRALACLTQAIYYEAATEPAAGQRAVAQVVINRMRHPAFPKSICGVIYQADTRPICQFTFVCDGSLNRAPERLRWRQAGEVAAAALSGSVEGAVGMATHYHADYVAPAWAPTLFRVAVLGRHIFYRGAGLVGLSSSAYAGETLTAADLRRRTLALAARTSPAPSAPIPQGIASIVPAAAVRPAASAGSGVTIQLAAAQGAPGPGARPAETPSIVQPLVGQPGMARAPSSLGPGMSAGN